MFFLSKTTVNPYQKKTVKKMFFLSKTTVNRYQKNSRVFEVFFAIWGWAQKIPYVT